MEMMIIAFTVIGAIYSTYCYNKGYEHGRTFGKAEGIVEISEFYAEKKAFKNPKNILGFKNWPEWLQFIVKNKLVEIKIVDAKKKN